MTGTRAEPSPTTASALLSLTGPRRRGWGPCCLCVHARSPRPAAAPTQPAGPVPPCPVRARLPWELPGHHLGCSGPAPRDGAGGSGCEGCCVPSRDVRDFSPSPASPPRGWTQCLALAAGAAPALLALRGPGPLYAEGRRGWPQPPRAPTHCDVPLRDPEPRVRPGGAGAATPRHVLCVCAWFVFNTSKM